MAEPVHVHAPSVDHDPVRTALDALADIVRENKLGADDIAEVEASLSQATYVHCAWEYKAQGVTAAQMNLYYGLAMIALDGTAFVDQYREERLRDPRVLAFIPRIKARIDPEIEAMGAQFRHAARVRVTTRDGRKFHAELLNRRGSAENPLAPADIEHKFRQVVRSCLAPAQIERVAGTLLRRLLEKDLVELAAPEATVRARFAALLTKNFDEEAAIEREAMAEAEKLVRQGAPGVRREDLDLRKVEQLVKQRIAKARGFVL